MRKLTPVSSALAALIIASALSGCGGGNVEPVSAPTSVNSAQTTTEAVDSSAEVTAAAEATKAAQESAAVEAAPVAKPTPKPAPAPAAAKTYANCPAMHADYKGGVARPGAVDHRTSGHSNYAPVYNTSLYNANMGSDRDGDGIACEA